jgi:hypothetical protein
MEVVREPFSLSHIDTASYDKMDCMVKTKKVSWLIEFST